MAFPVNQLYGIIYSTAAIDRGTMDDTAKIIFDLISALLLLILVIFFNNYLHLSKFYQI